MLELSHVQSTSLATNVSSYIKTLERFIVLILWKEEAFRQAAEANGYGVPVEESISSNIDDVTMQ